METNQKKQPSRRTGILLHPSSFNSPFGIGDFGKEARETLLKFADAGVTLWQILPLGPTGYGDSPYSSRSCFAGNEYLIDIRSIEGFENIDIPQMDNTQRVDYNYVSGVKMPLLKKCALTWFYGHKEDPDFVTFCRNNAWWLDDYALFQALVIEFNDSRWFLWPEDIKLREAGAMARWSEALSETISTFKALQYFFFKQWCDLHLFANKLGIRIIGDMPIFAAGDSADAWSHKELFKIDEKGNQYAKAGVPPDAFSPTGQMWGNPVYDWEEQEKDDYLWFRRRMAMTLKMVDIVRIDHFRGFEAYWEIPQDKETAEFGHWEKGPGMKLLKYFKGYNIIAEDLGVITDEVNKLRNDACFPGMKVLQFAFNLKDGKLEADHMYLPHNYPANCVAYTGTHDNQTSRGWYNDQSGEMKDAIRRYLQCPDEDVVWQMMRCLLACHAKVVVFPLQDLLGLDDEARMNKPSTVGSSNWSWRFNPQDLQTWMIERLMDFNICYGRV